MADETCEILDLSRRGLNRIEKATEEESKTINKLILDQNELQRLDNIDSYMRLENLSICNNFLLRMHGVSRLSNLRSLSLNNNGILQIEGLKEMTHLKVLRLAGNNIKSIEHLNNNTYLEILDLSKNQISFITDISYLRGLKQLNLEQNRIMDLRQCDRYLPQNLEHLGLGQNHIKDLNEVSFLVHLRKLESFTIQGNPCVSMAGKDKLGFDYRPFIQNWIMSLKSIDGFVVSAIESLKAEWLYSQGKGRQYKDGQHQELCEYLATACPLTADALETEDQRKLRLILSKAQHHQQQLKEQNHSPISRTKLQSPRMQCRITPRHMGRSPDRLTSSYHSGVSKSASPSSLMSLSCSGDIPQSLPNSIDKDKEQTPPKPINQSLEAASKMVPVPESLMSPDYHESIYDIQRSIPKPNSITPSSNGSVDDKHKSNSTSATKNLRGSPKLTKSATSSPKLKSKLEQRKYSLKIEPKSEEKKINGISKIEAKDKIDEVKKTPVNQKRLKKTNTESMAAVTIQKMWRGYRSRNLNKDALRIIHAIQAARARQHIQRLTCDMEATKAALDSERKIQQLQMQAINALWKKVSTIQDSQHKPPENDDNSKVLRQLTETCFNLQAQVVELQGSMQEVLKAVSNKGPAEPVATQTDIVAVNTPQLEERPMWLKRPQTLPLTSTSSMVPPITPQVEQTPINEEPKVIDIEPVHNEGSGSLADDNTDLSTDATEVDAKDQSLITD